jgi:uncharacterized protein YdhG (YjbR/CyaY superfamily)
MGQLYAAHSCVYHEAKRLVRAKITAQAAPMQIDWCVWRGSMKSKKETRKRAAATAGTGKAATGFTEEERAAMKERAEELKGSRAKTADGEGEVLAKIAEMPEADRALAMRIHAIVKAAAPALTPKTWYGMPAYARDGDVICYFQSAHKFKTRYATLGFSAKAKLDEGNVWPVAFALNELSADDETGIGALVKRAVSG